MSYFNKWASEPGAYVLVDGQFGSTGKGLLAAYIALNGGKQFNKVTTNAGPNSGHTAYWPHHLGPDGDPGWEIHQEKIVTQQLPVASVFLDKMGHEFDTIINAGAVIDYEIMLDELGKWMQGDGSRVLVHPSAALITEGAKGSDKLITRAIAGTGKGVGPAIVQKIMRTYGKKVIASHLFAPFLPPEYASWDNLWNWSKDVVFVETAQGFSLGINSARFYPTVTSRECTVQQALADARIPAQMLRKVVATFRTLPIRVGSTENSSGGWYPDQEETSWEALGVPQELTTVTKRVRRVATWSWIQFRECIATNRPDVLFINFANYMSCTDFALLMARVRGQYNDIMGHNPEAIFVGTGPLCSDVYEWDQYGG